MAQPLKTRLTTQRNFKVAWVSFPSLLQSTGEKPTKRRRGLLGLMIPNVWVHCQLAPLPWAWKNVWNTATPSSWQLGSGAVKVWGWPEPLTVLQQILTLCPTHCGLTSTLICCLTKLALEHQTTGSQTSQHTAQPLVCCVDPLGSVQQGDQVFLSELPSGFVLGNCLKIR